MRIKRIQLLYIPFMFEDISSIRLIRYEELSKQINYEKINNLEKNYYFLRNSNNYLFRKHQNRSAFNRRTKISQQGLEKRAQHQETKRIERNRENFIVGTLNIPVQTERQRIKRKKTKYHRHRVNF